MLAKLLRRIPLPRTLRWQFILTLGLLELLLVAGGLLAVNALRESAESTRQLAEARLVRLQEAQDLVQRTLLIEHQTGRMMIAASLEDMRVIYDQIITELESTDHLVEKLGSSSDDLSVLALHQSSQLFRNTAHVIASLREEILRDTPNHSQAWLDPKPSVPSADLRLEQLRQFHQELYNQALAMVNAAQALSLEFTSDYRSAVQQVAVHSSQREKWVIGLFIASVVLASLVYRFFLSRQVLARLQQVSNSLRCGDAGSERPKVPVEGSDEIAEMARAVEQFLEDRRRLAEANSELESFSYSVSHDLQAPLRAIHGFSGMLLMNWSNQLDEKGQHYLENISKSALRMRDLINDILEFSRMSRHRMATGIVDLAAMAQEVFDEIRSAAPPERQILLQLGSLPPVLGDRALIRQVLVNLISNAIKFTSHQAEARIELSCLETGELNTYCIRDNGVGFDMEYARELFGVFQRMHGSEFEGTGIGLAIVKRIILRHGGRIWADSKPGEGATFYFTLPSTGTEEEG